MEPMALVTMNTAGGPDSPGRLGGEVTASNSTLSLRPADHTLGDQGIDLAPGVSEFGQHFSRMLAGFRRGVAQACLGAFETDRRGDPLVPVLFDDVATMDGVGAGERLVDRLHRSGRQASGEQAIAQRLGVVLTEHRGEFGAQRVAVGDAVLVARKTRIGAEFGFADFLAELAEGAVIADADEDVAV